MADAKVIPLRKPSAATSASAAADAVADRSALAAVRAAGQPDVPDEPAVVEDVEAVEAAEDVDAIEDADGAGGGRWERKVAGGLAFLRRRITGEYEVDDFGYDEELTEQVLMSLVRPLYEKYFRVEVKGIENIPAEGGALVVANHSGTLPLDALMTQVAVHDNHPAGPASAAAGRGPGVRAAGRQRAGPQGRSHPGVHRGRRNCCWSAARWSG